MIAFLFIVFALMIFRLRSYKKRHKKALGKARKSDAEGESLKLLSEFKCLLFDFTVESDVFKISVVYFSFFAAPKYDYSEIICIFAPENKKITIMNPTIDTYRLTSMEEPSDAVLSQLMKEAAEEAKRTNDEATTRFFEQMREDAQKISATW